MSKLSQLKQKAYQAGKNRNWGEAIGCYEQILELEKNNPTVVNELGDLCLKAGEVPRAIKHFLTAASRYRKTGLLNNSVAIYKKILRHDDSNLSAHWYLADTRAGQGLIAEGENHADRFLSGGDKLAGDVGDVFLKRCVKLFELYPGSSGLMDRLVGIFRARGMSLESSRAQCLCACCQFEAGEKDEARAAMDTVLGGTPELRNYPEFGRWSQLLDPNTAQASQDADYNTVSLANGGGESADPAPAADTDTGLSPVADPAPSLKIEVPDIVPEAAEPTAESSVEPDVTSIPDPDEDGCISIDIDDDADLSDLVAAAAGDKVPAASTDEATASDAPPEAPEEEKIDLLAQILSEEGGGLGDESDQLKTISAEIGTVVGGTEGEDDAGRLYEMGMVYLEMGLFDQACESFSVAACDEEFALRAHEMWGLTLQRANNPDESVRVLTEGLKFASEGSRESLSLRYHIARAHELAERAEAAAEIYQDINETKADFLDVRRRLEQLVGIS